MDCLDYLDEGISPPSVCLILIIGYNRIGIFCRLVSLPGAYMGYLKRLHIRRLALAKAGYLTPALFF
jgi:hypothetical protein